MKNIIFSDRVRDMLKERKVYLILRKLEKNNQTAEPISMEELVRAVLEKNEYSCLWMTFKDELEVKRVFESLVPNSALHDQYYLRNVAVNGVVSVASADTRFSNPYFWNKWVEEVGFLKI